MADGAVAARLTLSDPAKSAPLRVSARLDPGFEPNARGPALAAILLGGQIWERPGRVPAAAVSTPPALDALSCASARSKALTPQPLSE